MDAAARRREHAAARFDACTADLPGQVCQHSRIAGLVLAAGMGRRFGMPKALVDTGSGPWVTRALATVASADVQMVVTGARAADVEALLPGGVIPVFNPQFADGMGSSLAAGLAALDADIDAAVVMLVDLPDVPAAATQRVIECARQAARTSGASLRSVLCRAIYDETPGHPVLLGADHFAGATASAIGDRGARAYLGGHGVIDIQCGDLASGIDQDSPPA